VLDFCEGYYEPNGTAKHPKKNVTRCANETAMYHFDPTKIISQELSKHNIDLSDINWPKDVEKGLHFLEAAFKAMFVLYCIGIAFTFLAFLGSVAGIFLLGRLCALLNGMLAFLAFIALAAASAILTAIAVKGASVINKYGHEIGIAAHKGGGMLAMTWAATALMIIATLTWFFECCVGRKRKQQNYYKDG